MNTYKFVDYVDKLNDNLFTQIDNLIKVKNLPAKLLLTNFSQNPDGPGRIELSCKNKNNDDIKVSIYIMSTHALFKAANYSKIDLRANIRTKVQTMDPVMLATVRVLRIIFDTATYFANHYIVDDNVTISIGLDGMTFAGGI